LKTGSTLALMIRANLAFLLSPRARGWRYHQPRPPVSLPPDFFGVCVASSEDPACDDYIVARLRELGLRCVRVDYGYESPGGFVERFVKRLAAEGFRVALHLVAPRKEVALLLRAEGAERWRRFLRDTFERFARGVELFEIGATVNRRRWSGFDVPLFLQAWDIAWEEAEGRDVVLAGPNVTDFEPFYNIPILHAMRQRGRLPAVHTNNLFVERATEPEAFDHKILGHRCAGWIKFNTVKKASLLGAIGRWADVPRTFSMHVSWSLRRIRRVLEEAEEQQADYVARYCCLAAASGGLNRLYWGPLIGQREGLVDDGTTFFPEIFHVTFYGRANGKLSDYRIRPAFHAFQAVTRFLAGTTFTRRVPAGGSLEILEFQSATHTLHAIWCRNGDCAAASDCYDAGTLSAAEVFDRAGAPLAALPGLFTQSPTYLRWQPNTAIQVRPSPRALAGVRISAGAEARCAPIERPEWRGLTLASVAGAQIDPGASLPDQFAPMNSSAAKVLRNKRNRVWSAPAPWDAGHKLVVKHFLPATGLRGWIQRFKPGKALRSWNGAHELLRRGIPTPRPVAWLEHPTRPHEHESYYICAAFEDGSSARQAFYAFNGGATDFLGLPASELYQEIAKVIAKMHGRGIFYRDLSAGNLMFRRTEKGKLEFALIDTGRVRAGARSLSIRQRLADLMRLCHPLAWTPRDEFLRVYFEVADLRFAAWMRLAFHYYDWKHRIKKQLRPWR